ncbi:MAG: branched-chain amino acid ABC transporter permease [Syntrophaceticus sp.]|nr:branched-chain amino acid ABC transporter permease [Syntrophaceticus sp.]MDD3315153.1 branched-chain amino acid ABC transporter permease [Syntrophaceticus sp.]MDD4359261.1 branched-chain amino acid ABC transporter permease [Syntrophaceticus sp.]MDD4782109.1 branched-chain amino acid ABC transporter permease [Syntrophaceticus sp.]HBI26609.1 branched-chain amino acid ABC transporter permease [Peptococcaceae bacterium]
MEELLQQLFNGLSLGSIYALIAVGYTMIYGIVKLINFAHGDVMMVGAYVALAGTIMGLGFIPSLVIAMIACAFLGVLIELVAYRRVRPVSRLAALTSAIGMSLFLEYTMMYFVGAETRTFPPGVLTERTYNWAGIIITNKDLLVLGTTVILVIFLQFIIYRTRTGKAMRAVSYDGQAAQLMGINVNNTISITFFIGSALAAAAGMLIGMYYNSINPLMGMMPGLKAFIAAVLGGIGSVPGAMLGGILLGMTESLVAGFGGSMYRDAVAFIILILVLLVRPTGLLGKDTQEKV